MKMIADKHSARFTTVRNIAPPMDTGFDDEHPQGPCATAWPAVISSCAAAAASGIVRAQTVRQSETGGIDAQAMPDTEMMGRILLI